MSVAERELEVERRVGHRIIRAGDVVKITGLGRGCVRVDGELRSGFKVLGFRGGDVLVYGAKTPKRVPHLRTFPVERIGARPRGSGG